MNLDVKQIKKDLKETCLFTAGYLASVVLGTALSYKIQQLFLEANSVLISPYAWETYKTEPLATLVVSPVNLGIAVMLLLIIVIVLEERYTIGDDE